MRDETTNNKESSNRSSVDRTKLESRSNDSNNYPRSPSAEDRLRQRLVVGNENIRNINVSIEKFFKG